MNQLSLGEKICNSILRILPLLLISINHSAYAQCSTPGLLPTNDCATAPLICLENWCTENGLTTAPFPMNGFCGPNTVLHNPQFYSFIANDPYVEIDIHVDDCDSGNGLQSAIIGACPWTSPDEVLSCDLGKPPGTTMYLSVAGLEVGQMYWLLVDGSGGALCNYTIKRTRGVAPVLIIDELSEELTVVSDSTVQPGNQVFTIDVGPSIPNAHGYYWTQFGDTDTLTSTLPSFTFDIPCDVPPGTYDICVRAFSGCDTTENEICVPIVVEGLPLPVIKDTATLCPDTFPFLWHTLMITGPGDYVQHFPTTGGCTFDSLWTITSRPASTAIICCDQTLCDACSALSITLSGYPPWDISLLSNNSNETRLGVTDEQSHFSICPPLGESTYWFYVTDGLQNCAVDFEGQDIIEILNEPRPEINLYVQGEEFCVDSDSTNAIQWFNCDSILLSTSKCFDYPGPGCYCVEVTTASGCMNRICEFVDATETLIAGEQIQIYPQPSSGEITIELVHAVKLPVHWTLFNIMGSQLEEGSLQSHSETILFQNENLKGMYMLKLSDEQGKSIAVKLMLR